MPDIQEILIEVRGNVIYTTRNESDALHFRQANQLEVLDVRRELRREVRVEPSWGVIGDSPLPSIVPVDVIERTTLVCAPSDQESSRLWAAHWQPSPPRRHDHVYPNMPPPELRAPMTPGTDYLTANKRAQKMFLSLLSPSEFSEYESFSTVTISTPIGAFRIKISKVTEIPTFNVMWQGSFCCLVISSIYGFIPYYDHIIMQLLLIKTNPALFVDKANIREEVI